MAVFENEYSKLPIEFSEYAEKLDDVSKDRYFEKLSYEKEDGSIFYLPDPYMVRKSDWRSNMTAWPNITLADTQTFLTRCPGKNVRLRSFRILSFIFKDFHAPMSQLNKIQEEIELEWKAYINLEGTIHDAYITFLSPHFTFGQSTLYLQLGGKFIRNPEETTLGLIRKDDFRMKFHSTLCTFGLKMQDGDVLMLGTQVMKENDKQIIKRFRGLSEEIAQRLEDILHNDLTLTFTLKLEVIHRVEPDISNEPQCKKLREESTLSRDFEDLFINKLNCDVTVQVKDKEYPAHKAILVARSKAFEEMFLQENAENCSGIITVRDCDPDAFYHFLKYLYCGSLGTLSFQHAFALYEIAAKYDVLELKIFCREKILENFIVEKFDEVVALADKYDDVILMSSLEYYFHEKAEDIIETAGWRNLIQNKSSLTSRLLGRQFR